MKKVRLITGGFLLHILMVSGMQAFAVEKHYDVKPEAIQRGYITEKIWLNEYAIPKVEISGIEYADVSRGKDMQVADPQQLTVSIGMERKRPFAVVRIPAYAQGASQETANRVAGFTLNVIETPQGNNSNAAAKITSVTTSELASGTWYKIGIAQTGFYKIDHTFLTSLGLSPGSINPANIRVFGNGGRMLPEANSVAHSDDLVENAVYVSSNGGTFGAGDYVVFYGVGPTAWTRDGSNDRFIHQKNIYADTAYYFITVDKGPGLRIPSQGAAGTANKTVTDFNYYDVHEVDLVSPSTFGKTWYGEQFNSLSNNLTQSFNFDIGAPVSSVYCRFWGGETGDAGSRFTLSLNGQNIGVCGFNGTAGDKLMDSSTLRTQGTCNSSSANFQLTFSPVGSSVGYLNYLEINTRRPLQMSGDQLSFRDLLSVGTGNVANYTLQGANGNTRVWDITNPQVPVVMNGSLSGSAYSFTQDAATLHEFAAMNSTNLLAPKYIGRVANQNLHGSGQVDFIIVTAKEFLAQAERLADYHRRTDNMRVIVATTEQVYNEFSSGSQDIGAIRDFARMFYKRAGTDVSQMPRYILLFGTGSYDYKNRVPNNCNYVPVFHSREGNNNISGFFSDDFYGFLDDNEDIENYTVVNAMDIGVGRLPARSVEDATILVDKILSYKKPSTLGPWRINGTFVGDDTDDAGSHSKDADTMATKVTEVTNNLMNEHKIYLGTLPMVSTPAGGRCPLANNAINDRVFKGTFMINYNGHGNPTVWAGERVLTQDDFSRWNNATMLPFMITATCDFGDFNHPQFVSAAEQLALRRNGGVISVLTTTAGVFASYNKTINQQYLDAQYTKKSDGTWNTFGEAYMHGKNGTYMTTFDQGEIINFRKFVLLGDPALTPDFPTYNVSIDTIKDGFDLSVADTFKALGKYTVSGSVRDLSGNVLNGFNGLCTISIYDKYKGIATIRGSYEVYNVQENIIYKGKVSVTNGHFTFTFIAPKDINYYFGTGKISTYAQNEVIDGAGADTSFAVGGYSDHPVLNDLPPIVKPYINDSLFLNGGITGTNTSLFVVLNSQTGINVSGNNLGHDLTAVLDGNVEQPYILNDYYETAPNTYQLGYVSFPVTGLANGRHTIKVKAWDVNNNSGEGSVDFIVIDGNIMAIQNLMNYPNPFSNTTHFVFEHNHPEEEMDVNLNIYDIRGAVVKEIREHFTPTGSRSNEITWDGCDKGGARLPSGVYVYKINIVTEKGFQSTAYQKLVIVR
jgi:hypothetical protein